MIIDRAPTSVDIAGYPWPIRTDFRYWVQFERLILDSSVPDEDKAVDMLELLFPWVPDDQAEAGKKIIWFWQCGIEHGGSGGGTGRQIYDLERDSGYIFSAFDHDYGIDIESVKYMHWWKFKHRMMNLKPDNLFCRILDYRGADLSKKKGDERQHYEEMRRFYSLPLDADEQAKQEIIMNALMGDGDVQGALQRAGMG